jgi:dsDNA-specific endonuclease/ATPase MutS2
MLRSVTHRERKVAAETVDRAEARARSRAGRSIVDRPRAGPGAGTVEAVKLKLDLHDVFNRGQDIDRALRGIIDEAVAKKATLVEIIPGKGSGQLKKRVLRFLDQKEVKALYHRVEKDSQNWGRLFVHFRWK